MSTCKTFEKEMLLPHIFRGARDVKVIKKGGADQKQQNKTTHQQAQQPFEMTQRN